MQIYGFKHGVRLSRQLLSWSDITFLKDGCGISKDKIHSATYLALKIELTLRLWT